MICSAVLLELPFAFAQERREKFKDQTQCQVYIMVHISFTKKGHGGIQECISRAWIITSRLCQVCPVREKDSEANSFVHYSLMI